MRFSPNAQLRYGASLALVAATMQLSILLQRHLAFTPAAPFIAVVAITSWFGGIGCGAFTTAVSAPLIDYFLIPPLHDIRFDPDHLVRLFMFVATCSVVIGLSHSLQRQVERGRARERQLAHELAERRRIEADRAALLLREREVRRQAEAAQQRLAFLADAGRVVASSLDVTATLDSLGRLAVPALCDWCVVLTVQPDGAIKRSTVAGPPASETLAQALRARPPSAALAATPIGRRVLQGERLLFAEVDDAAIAAVAEDKSHAELLRRLGVKSFMIVPLQVHRDVLGAVTFLATASARRFTPDDLALADAVAGRAAAALANAQLYEEADAANRAKDEFLATVSHELRTPLHAILGWARLLRTGALNDEASAKAVETIERNAQAQAHLVADILDVSRIVAGKLRVELRPVAVGPVVEAALDSVRPSAHAKGVELGTQVETPDLYVSGDAGRLQQIVWNLLSNAVKFTPASGRVDLDLRERQGAVELRVADTGIGIDRAFLPHVFERFRQADGSITRVHGGLGLGLAIVRHLVELLGGSVVAESDGPDRGAAFTVRLPAVAAACAPAAVRETVRAPDRDLASLLRGLRLLVVDDQEDARQLVAAELVRFGADVTMAVSTQDALERVGRDRPDVLVADIAMPGEDGYALIRTLRRRTPEEGSETPAIALTALATPQDRAQALEAGYEAHLVKPIESSRLAETVALLIGRAIT